MTTPATAATAPARMPRQLPFIIGNEACERFSFYGMRNILVQFLITSLLLQEVTAPGREAEAKHIMHSFMIGVYFFPLLGGWLADRFSKAAVMRAVKFAEMFIMLFAAGALALRSLPLEMAAI
ncbi:MAG TPA: hypothetical protein VGC74_17085, partial [Stenotrophomonas sp.]